MGETDRDPKEIVLSMAAGTVPAPQFKVAVDELIRLAKNAVVTESGLPISWHVAVESGSQVLRMIPESNDTPESVIAAATRFRDDFKSLAQTTVTIAPPSFTPAVLESIGRLSRLTGRGAGAVSMTIGGEQFPFTESLAERVKEVERSGYSMHGSVEGRLEIINVHTDNLCSIYRDLDNQRIKVRFDDGLFEDFRAALGNRALVSGRIDYDPYDRIKIVVATSVRPLRKIGDFSNIDDLIDSLNQ